MLKTRLPEQALSRLERDAPPTTGCMAEQSYFLGKKELVPVTRGPVHNGTHTYTNTKHRWICACAGIITKNRRTQFAVFRFPPKPLTRVSFYYDRFPNGVHFAYLAYDASPNGFFAMRSLTGFHLPICSPFSSRWKVWFTIFASSGFSHILILDSVLLLVFIF